MGRKPLVLAIDVGNSRIKCGLLEAADRLPGLRCAVAVDVDQKIPWTTLAGWVAAAGAGLPTTAISGSNVTRIEQVTKNWPLDLLPRPLSIGDFHQIPVAVDLPDPGSVGVDRLLNAAAANRIRPAAKSALIVDCGTATTVDLVSRAGAFAGGAILPGVQLSAQALHRATDRLPLLDSATLSSAPGSPAGRDTAAAIHSGLYWGHVGAIRELIERISSLVSDPLLLLLTGGGGEAVRPYLSGALYEPNLTLQGLALSAVDSMVPPG